MANTDESGLRPQRLEWVTESTYGAFESDPSWNLFSDTVTSFGPSIQGNISGQRGVGDATIKNIFAGAEDSSFEVVYHLQNDADHTITDDALNDAIVRDSDNTLNNSHNVVGREDHSTGGTAGGGYREYFVAKGAYVDSAELSGDPDNEPPIIEVSLTYEVQKARVYTIDQPSSSTTLDISSSDSNDTMDITIEDEGASTSETVTLSGTTTVTTTSSFGNIDAALLASKPTGDVTITDGSGNNLLVIRGSNSTGGAGDLGVPTLGTGSHASAIGSSYANVLNDSIDRPDGTALAEQVANATLTVENNTEKNTQVGERGQHVTVGPQDVSFSADIYGEKEGNLKYNQHIQTTTDNIDWTIGNDEIRIDNAGVEGDIDVTREAEQAVLVPGVDFLGQGITLNP